MFAKQFRLLTHVPSSLSGATPRGQLEYADAVLLALTPHRELVLFEPEVHAFEVHTANASCAYVADLGAFYAAEDSKAIRSHYSTKLNRTRATKPGLRHVVARLAHFNCTACECTCTACECASP